MVNNPYPYQHMLAECRISLELLYIGMILLSKRLNIIQLSPSIIVRLLQLLRSHGWTYQKTSKYKLPHVP
jgi:hypothetical protein